MHLQTGKSGNGPLIKGILWGAACTMIITFLLSIALAWFLSAEYMSAENIGYGILVGTLVSSVAGCAVGCAISQQKRLIVCAGIGVSYFLLLISVTALLFDGMYQSMGVTALLILGSALATALVPGREKKMTYRRNKK